MNSNDVKREILLHANLLAPGEVMTQEQGAMSIHQTVGAALSSVTNSPEHVRSWTAGQIAYCLARALECVQEQS